ncbi:unnamed protein product, partial [Allacma fusca]
MAKGNLDGQDEKTTEISKLNPDETQFEGTNTTEMSLRAKYLTTAVIYFCNITFGMSATYLAPIVIDFKTAYQTDMAAISVVFTMARIIMLVSSLA